MILGIDWHTCLYVIDISVVKRRKQFYNRHTSTDSFLIKSRPSDVMRHKPGLLLAKWCNTAKCVLFENNAVLGYHQPSIKIKRGIIIVHCNNKRLLETLKHQRLSIFKIFFTKRKSVQTVNKTTASQKVTRRRKSSTSVHPSFDVDHGIGRGLSNDTSSLRNWTRIAECKV